MRHLRSMFGLLKTEIKVEIVLFTVADMHDQFKFWAYI